jgi:hypothetical protein
LCSLTRFWRNRGRRVQFSCFALPDSFSMVLRVSRPVFMFSTPRLVFSGIEDVGSRFHVLCSLTRFRRCRMRRVPFLYFARPDSFSAVSRTSCPIFMFCEPGHVFDCAEGVGSRFHISSAHTRFRRYRGCWAPFSCFARPDTFSAEPSASGPVFMFCSP